MRSFASLTGFELHLARPIDMRAAAARATARLLNKETRALRSQTVMFRKITVPIRVVFGALTQPS
jgi:hypothetical protein